LPDPPAWWGWGKTAHLLVGSLAHSSRWRAVLAPAEDQPHLIEALDAVVRRLGGLTHRWRFDRMATVCHPDPGRLTATFGPVAAHYLLTELGGVVVVSSRPPLLHLPAWKVTRLPALIGH
jgi:hypothetical protein